MNDPDSWLRFMAERYPRLGETQWRHGPVRGRCALPVGMIRTPWHIDFWVLRPLGVNSTSGGRQTPVTMGCERFCSSTQVTAKPHLSSDRMGANLAVTYT